MVLKHSSHNQVYNRMKKGDLIQFKRKMYSHWAVVVDDEHVVHYAGDEGDGDINFSGGASGGTKATIRKESYWNVVEDSPVMINNALDKSHKPDSVATIVKRALESIGRKGYNLIWKNCEHFATWCRYGKEISKQVERGLTLAAGAAVVGGLIGLLGYALTSSQREEEAERSKQKK